MPGVNDGHSHPSMGGSKTLYHCVFAPDVTPDLLVETLRACVADKPDADWIIGGQWASDFFSTNQIDSPRKFLDDISSDKVILLGDDTGHSRWVNSAGLTLAGITADTPDPDGGIIVRDADGEPNGLLHEEAMQPVEELQPKLTLEQMAAALSEAMAQANSYGVTGLNEAMVGPELLDAWAHVDKTGTMTLRVVTNLLTAWEYRDTPLDIDFFIAQREKYELSRVNANYVKFFLDGVPTTSRTAVMLQDYLTDEKHPEPTRGRLLVDPDVMANDLVVLDKAGFTVKLHAAGDGSVRAVLDALQVVRETNGDSGLRHEIAHAGFIDPVDLPRFAALNVTADLSPPLWYPSPVTGSLREALGERAEQYFPVKDLLDSGANVLLGSDWPSITTSVSPWHAIEAFVTRRNPYTNGEETYWPEQAINLEQALNIVTVQGARALQLEDLTGSLAVGKSADFIVLNHNLFEIPPEQISDTQVLKTWFEGRQVYSRDGN
jgi:predicted amidohydrolase YtcJ